MPRWVTLVGSVPLLAALSLAGCAQNADPPPVAVSIAAAGLTKPIYQSGSRLKVRWAEPVGEDAWARVPLAIFDAKLGRDCALEYGPGDAACIPVADADPGFDDIAFLDADETEPALIALDEACTAGAARVADRRIFAIPLHRGHSPNRYVAGEPRRVGRLWVAAGVGCTPHYEERRQTRCVRPLLRADLRDVVKTKETRFGRERDPSGIVVAVGTDGSVLPLRRGAEYVDAANDIRCSLDSDACVPRLPNLLTSTPTLGAEATVHLTSGPSTKWGHRFGDDVWAALSPAPSPKPATQTRKVVALLTREQALHFAPFSVGRGRIVLHGLTMPDGRRVPISLHDTQLERDCVATKMDDGRWRCTVELPRTCQETSVLAGGVRTEALSPSTSFCNKPETCCKGGPIWFPRIPARGPRRFDVGPDLSWHPAVPGRAVRFSETPRETDHVALWQAQKLALVWDKVEDLEPETFAEVRIVQDP